MIHDFATSVYLLTPDCLISWEVVGQERSVSNISALSPHKISPSSKGFSKNWFDIVSSQMVMYLRQSWLLFVFVEKWMNSWDKLHGTSKLHWTDFLGSWNCCTYASSVIRSIIIVRTTNSILTFELITNFWFWQNSSNQWIICYFHSFIFPHKFFYYWINHWFIFTSYLLFIFMSRFIIIVIFRLLFKIEGCSRK